MPRDDTARASNAASARRAGDRLRALRGAPERQAEEAAALLADSRSPEIVLAAVAVLEAHAYPPAHDALVALVRWYGDSPVKRDAGGMLRSSILRALRPISIPGDLALFDAAATTYESTPQDRTGPGILRAAGLAGMVALDPESAAVRAAQLLADSAHTSPGNGEPALTAVRALAVLEQRSALVLFLLLAEPAPSEVTAEAYRGLLGLPGAVLRDLLGRIPVPRDDLALLGRCDLLVEHEGDGELLPLLTQFLDTTTRIEVYQSVTATMAASRREALIHALIEHTGTTFDRRKLAVLREAMGLVPGREGEAARYAIDERLGATEKPD